MSRCVTRPYPPCSGGHNRLILLRKTQIIRDDVSAMSPLVNASGRKSRWYEPNFAPMRPLGVLRTSLIDDCNQRGSKRKPFAEIVLLPAEDFESDSFLVQAVTEPCTRLSICGSILRVGERPIACAALLSCELETRVRPPHKGA